MKYFLESCCTSISEILNAQQQGASRIELCENLECGGVTPHKGLVEEAIAISRIPVNVLVRCRGGNFHYSDIEIETMVQSIKTCREAGASGVVIGALDEKGDIDKPAMRKMIAAAGPMSITFHRAFDECREPLQAFDDIVKLGCKRLLTSGHEADAYTGRFMISELVRRSASSSIVVMAGCGVRKSNIDEIIRVTGVKECHASAAFFRE